MTLVELMVALFLVSLLMVFIVSGNIFVKRYLGNWEDNNIIYEDGRFILSAISNDLKKAYEFSGSDSTGYIFSTGAKDSIIYEISEGGIYRNGKRINSADVFCSRFGLDKIMFQKNTPDSILIGGVINYQERLVNIKLGLIYKKLSENFETSVRLQNENFIF